MNRLDPEKRAAVIACLVEGNSIRATVRITGVAKNTVTKLLVDLGTACSVHMDRSMRELPCERVQVDEIWAFVGAKQKNVRPDDPDHAEYGDVWTWVALDPDTKLVPTFRVGPRDAHEARQLMEDLSRRLANRVQLTTDGHKPYLVAVDKAFDGEVDYAQLIKIYRNSGGGRYSPAECIGAERFTVFGAPDPDHIGTSHVERQNLHMRMSMRRFTRLTNAFSKKVENLACAVALHFTYYNFCRAHSALGKGVSPAMAAGVTDHIWTLQELMGLLEAAEATPVLRGPYRKTRERQLSS